MLRYLLQKRHARPLSLLYSSDFDLASIKEGRDGTSRPTSYALIVCLCPAWSCHHTLVGRWMGRFRSADDVAWNECCSPPAALRPRDGMCRHVEPQRETFIKGLAPTLCSDIRMRAPEKTRIKRSKWFSSTILCMRGDAGGVSGGNQNKVQRSPRLWGSATLAKKTAEVEFCHSWALAAFMACFRCWRGWDQSQRGHFNVPSNGATVNTSAPARKGSSSPEERRQPPARKHCEGMLPNVQGLPVRTHIFSVRKKNKKKSALAGSAK